MGIVNLLQLSIHLRCGLPLGLFPFISPTKTFLVVLPLFISSSLPFQLSHLLFTRSKTSFLIQPPPNVYIPLSNLFTPSILLITFICVACTFDCCCFVRLHVSHLYISTGITVAFTTFNLVLQLNSFSKQYHSILQSLSLHSLSWPLIPSPYFHHY